MKKLRELLGLGEETPVTEKPIGPRVSTDYCESGWPPPCIMEMHDWQNRDWGAEKPNWPTGVGSWMYWGWNQVYGNDFAPIEEYLSKAATMDKPVAISIMLIEGLGADSTPHQVYAAIGREHGWPMEPDERGGDILYHPAWNDAGWDSAYRSMVMRLGEKFDGDPRVHSVWICTGFYGETVQTIDGYTLGFNMRQFAQNAIEWYAAAFEETPCFVMTTGTNVGAEVAAHAAKFGVGVKQNTLNPDSNNQVGIKSMGLFDQLPAPDVVPRACEHAYANTPSESYWSMLTALLVYHATVLDLPEKMLNTLASVHPLNPQGDSLFSFIQKRMGEPGKNQGPDHINSHMFLARDTVYPPVESSWTSGDVGAWTRDALVIADPEECQVFPPRGAEHSIMPDTLRESMYAAHGAAKLDGTLRLVPKWPLLPEEDADKDWHVVDATAWAIVAGDIELCARIGYEQDGIRAWDCVATPVPPTSEWTLLQIEGDIAEIEITGNGYVHLLALEGYNTITTTEPPYPPEEPSELEDRIVALESEQVQLRQDIDQIQNVFAAAARQILDDMDQGPDSLAGKAISKQAELGTLPTVLTDFLGFPAEDCDIHEMDEETMTPDAKEEDGNEA